MKKYLKKFFASILAVVMCINMTYYVVQAGGEREVELSFKSVTTRTDGFLIRFNAPGVTTDDYAGYYEGDKLIIDGVQTSTNTSSTYFNSFTETEISLLLNVNKLEADATSVAGLKQAHTLTIPAGAIIGSKFVVTNDVNLIIENGTVTADTTKKITLGWDSCFAQDNWNRFLIYFTAPGVEVANYYAGNSLIIDGEQTTTNPYNMYFVSFEAGVLGLLLPYDKLETGVTTAAGLQRTHTLTIPAGAVIGDKYKVTEDFNVIIENGTVTEKQESGDGGADVPSNDLPDSIVIPAHNYRNQEEERNKDFYFTPLGTNPLPNNTNPGYTFKTGGIYVNGSPLSGVTMSNYGYCYYVWLGQSTQLKPGNIVTIDGIVEADGKSVQFQRTDFVVDENQHMFPLGSNDDYTSNLEDVYVDLGEHSYVIPESDSIKINDKKVDAQTSRKLLTAGEYAIERVKGNVTYKQNVICYQTGDANADGDVNIIDLIAAKNSSEHTKPSESKGADVTNDSEVDGDDFDIIRDLLIEKVDATEVRDEYQEMVFGVISDVHLTATTDKREQDNLKKALEYYKSNNAELIIVNGDLTDRGTEDSYKLLLNIINEVYPDNEPRPQIMFTTGNHEFYDAWPGGNNTGNYDACATLFKGSLNLDSSNNHYTLGGYDFITISLDATEGTYGGVGQYKPDTVKYLQEQLQLATDRDGNKPIFVALHIPLEDAGAEFSEKNIYTESDIYSILKDYKQVVLFSSHTHNILNDERAIMQDDFTAIDTASLHYSSVTDKTLYKNTSADWSKESALFAQGLLIRVKQNQVNVGRWDFIYDRPIGTAWSFESKDVTKYRSDRQNSAPTFNENSTVNAIWNTKTSCAISFNPAVATEGSNVQRYKIEVSNEGSVVDTYYYFNDYMDREAPEYVTYTVNGLDCNKNYTFTITAEETFGSESSPISGEISACTNEN